MTELERSKETTPSGLSLPPRAGYISDDQEQTSTGAIITPTGSSIRFLFAKSDPALEAIAPEIDRLIRKAVIWSADKIPLPDVDILVYRDPYLVIPQTGVGGHAPTAHLVRLSVDPKNEHFAGRMELEVAATIAHELHHCSRWSTPAGYGTTLREALVSEGLAQHFETDFRFEQCKANTKDEVAPRYAKALGEDQLRDLLVRAKKEFDSTTYSHPDWFFGYKQSEIPMHAGYAIGFDLVCKHLKEQGGKDTAATLVHAHALTICPRENNEGGRDETV